MLQVSAGDPNLRLPYWDYDNPAQLAMPAEFTTPTYVNDAGQTVPNPLFEPKRAPLAALMWNTPRSTVGVSMGVTPWRRRLLLRFPCCWLPVFGCGRRGGS